MTRHPKLVLKNGETLEKYRAQLTQEYIRSWFRDLKTFLTESKALNIVDNPSRMLNADETGFRLCPKTGRVLGLKGHNLYVVKTGNEKENLTVLITFTADGGLCPPIIDSVPSHWILGKSDTGWMRSEVFYEFVANGLNNWLEKENIQKPVLFLVNGHKSHVIRSK
ncbi:hypothetical protein NQ314_017823 [Rhamnusium bicolor]|uniref:DDE-1 domain-containing protein n=1 Tax=Rhamnusium bicolor TaxID=1586634 RepID=A0AAV8WSS5_9CUCU|nr:hypothetical protein NQ314_017823 [Rhamnusium bicolor]